MKLLKLYEEDLIKASENQENRLIFNDRAEKANIFMNVLMKHAKKTIRIYSNNLNSEVTGLDGFVETLENVLSDKDIKVEILLNEDTNNEDIKKLFSTYITKDYNNYLKKLFKKDCINKIFEKDVHFIIVDDNAYRIEHDVIGYQAIGNFNNTEMCKGLITLYNNLFSDNCSK